MSLILKSIKNKRGIRRYIGPKRIILLVALTAFVIFAWDYYRAGTLSPTIIEQYRDNHPVGAVLLFVLIYAVSVIASVPSLPLNLAAGFFWGGFVGGIYSTIGVTIGGVVFFSFGRGVIRQPLSGQFCNKWWGRGVKEFW